MHTILIVEDSQSLARTYQAQLHQCGLRTILADTGKKARAQYENADLILLDLGLPDEDGIDILNDWVGETSLKPVVVITANGSVNTAIKAMRGGAKDFLVKPFPGERLVTTIENILETLALKKTVRKYEKHEKKKTFAGFVGESTRMKSLYGIVENAAQSKATVMITGESGTGKELVARAIHDASTRSQKSFVAINCSAIPKDLMESELFGHVKGAFTGATSDRDGAASQANGGTLFLDEIGEMDINLQSKLLRFLQLSTYQKVGDTKTINADIRFVAATNRDPIGAVRGGLLREDLFYRLNVLPIELPALRDRGSDVILLAEYFLSRYSAEESREFETITQEAQELLQNYDWPGNVRELENMIRQIIVMNAGKTVEPFMVNTAIYGNAGKFAAPRRHDQHNRRDQHNRHGQAEDPVASIHSEERDISSPQHREEAPLAPKPMWQVELDSINQAITYCGGNIQRAAHILEINPSTIYRKKARAEKRGPELTVADK